MTIVFTFSFLSRNLAHVMSKSQNTPHAAVPARLGFELTKKIIWCIIDNQVGRPSRRRCRATGLPRPPPLHRRPQIVGDVAAAAAAGRPAAMRVLPKAPVLIVWLASRSSSSPQWPHSAEAGGKPQVLPCEVISSIVRTLSIKHPALWLSGQCGKTTKARARALSHSTPDALFDTFASTVDHSTTATTRSLSSNC